MRIVERARVVAVENGRARLAIGRPRLAGGAGGDGGPARDGGSGCRGCPAAAACGTGDGARLLSAEAPAGVAPGDEVTLVIEGPSPALAALLLLFLPLGAGVGAGLAAYHASGAAPIGLLAGLGGVAAVYLALYLTRSRHRARVEIVPAARLSSPKSDAGEHGNHR